MKDLLCNKFEERDRINLLAKSCVSINSQMIDAVIEGLINLDVEYIIAPYEADSQIAYLFKQGKVSGGCSEDSDLLVYGCSKLLTKVDFKSMTVREVNLNRLFLNPRRNGEWLIHLAVLSGCDYGGKLKGVGILRAAKLLDKFGNGEKVVESKLKGSSGLTHSLNSFIAAVYVYKYSWVYVLNNECVRLNELPDTESTEKIDESVGLCKDNCFFDLINDESDNTDVEDQCENSIGTVSMSTYVADWIAEHSRT